MTAARSLRTRIAGQRAMREVVDAEAVAAPRSRIERMLGIRALSEDSRRAYDTALGDVVVGRVLEQLGPQWDVLHDVPIGARTSIDHVAIGPGGVWAIRAVHCAGADVVVEGGALTVGGVARDDLLELSDAAATASHLLSASSGKREVGVSALFVAVDPGRIVVRAPPGAVGVISLPLLRRTVVQGRPRLSGDAVASISDIADRPGTWPTAIDDDTAALQGEFGAIRERVSTALRRRTGWAIAAFSAGALTMWSAIATYVTFVVLG